MEITKIQLQNFRNHKNTVVEFKSGLNVIAGSNAQGKTNLLEAIYFCVVGKSFRARYDKDVINFENETSKIKLDIKKHNHTICVEVALNKKQNKAVKINGVPINKIGELMGEFNGVFFAPDELKLIKESPDDRRRFMDVDISQTNKEYFYLLNRYNKILKNRNRQLKTPMVVDKMQDIMHIWDIQFADAALKIAKYRKNFVENLAPLAKKAHAYLTDNKENLETTYVGIEETTQNQIVQRLQEDLLKDIKQGYTGFGPHRDDIKVCLNGIDVRLFGSQGQQRTCALSLKLAEVEIIKSNTNSYPVLLLDDVLSELDDNRKKKLLAFSKKTQTIITCTSFDFDYPCNKIQVENGQVIE